MNAKFPPPTKEDRIIAQTLWALILILLIIGVYTGIDYANYLLNRM